VLHRRDRDEQEVLLKNCNSGPLASVDIGADEFCAIEEAKAKLTAILGIEEKFALLVENYAEYERTLLDLSLKNRSLRSGMGVALPASFCGTCSDQQQHGDGRPSIGALSNNPASPVDP
jgi:hypothetical protein